MFPAARHLRSTILLFPVLAAWAISAAPQLRALSAPLPSAAQDGTVVKAVLTTAKAGANLLRPDRWGKYEQGYQRKGSVWICNNGKNAAARRGASQTVTLNQTRPEPIVATAWSKAEGVTGSPDSDYSLYLDLVYDDGTPLWGQTADFSTGTHDWQRCQVVVLPEKPVKTLTLHLLLRRHGGKASFRDPELRVVRTPQGACQFDGVPVVCRQSPRKGFQVRDVAAGSGFVRIEKQALGLKLDCRTTDQGRGPLAARFFDVTLTDTTGKDRAITLVYAVSLADISGGGPAQAQTPATHAAASRNQAHVVWLEDPRQASEVVPGREYVSATRFHAGASGRLSRYPLGAIAANGSGLALGIDMAYPALFSSTAQ